MVMAVAEFPANPKVLQWAREERGLTVQQAAERLGLTVAELEEYETGARQPSITFLRGMAAKYRINFASLLMPDPLPHQKTPTDYRTRSQWRGDVAFETRVAIQTIRDALEVFEELAERDPKLVPRLDIGTADIDDDPEVVAANERRRFHVSVPAQQSWKGPGMARRMWRAGVERRGVFTYMIALPDCSGLSILSENRAAICINDAERTEGDLPAFFGPAVTGERRRSARLRRSRVLPWQREPA